MNKTIPLLTLLLLLLGGASLRLIGLTWGLPYQLHPDEPVLFINAWELHDTGRIRLMFDYPPAYLYLLAGQRELLLRLFGAETPQTVYFFFGRWKSIAFSLLFIALAYRTGIALGRLLPRLDAPLPPSRVGLLFMLFAVLDPLSALDQGWLIKADPLGWLLCMGVLWAGALAASRRGGRWLALAFFLSAAAGAVKYNLVLIGLFPLFIALALWTGRPWRTGLALCAAAFGTVLTAFILIQTFWVGEIAPRTLHCSGDPLSPAEAARALEFLPCEPVVFFQTYLSPFFQRERFLDEQMMTGLESAWRGVGESLRGGRAVFALILPLGLLWLGRSSSHNTLSLPALYTCVALLSWMYAVLGADYPARQYYPLVLCLGALWAIGLAALPSLSPRPFYALVVLALFAPLLSFVLAGRADLLKPDSRAASAEWMLSHARRGESVVVEYDSVEFSQQYGGFPRPQGYYNVLRVEGLHQLEAERLFAEGIYYVIADSRAAYHPESYLRRQTDTPDGFFLAAQFGGRAYSGPDRWIFRTFRPQTQVGAHFGQSIRLEGYDFSLTGHQATLRLYWQAEAAGLPAYSVFVHILEAQSDDLLAQADSPPPRPTPQWKHFEWIFDHRTLDLSALSPGNYQFKIGVYDPLSGERLPVTGGENGALALAAFSLAD